jgi:UDP-N-acetylmuramate dehydrogenase
MDILQDVALKEYAWWRIGGPAEYFCQPRGVEEVREAVEFASGKKMKITVLGGGTNVLISDQGVEGLVICMRQLVGADVVEGDGFVRVEALAGTPKSELTRVYLKRKLAPALFLCGLPGDVGGGVVMNAGVGEAIVPREFVEIVEWVEFLDLRDNQVKRVKREELQWTYRHSSGWEPGIIVRAGVIWPDRPDPDIPKKVREATKARRDKQPLELPSCGSTFKNPHGHKAGALIDQAGLKGFRVGGAQISPKHANFIVNTGGATAKDVDEIIRAVKSAVKERFQVELESEVRYLGRW